MKNRLFVSSTLLGLAVIVLAAQASYSFKLSTKVGDVRKTKVSIDAEVQGMKVQQSQTTTEKVTAIDDKGQVTTETTVTDSKLLVGGNEMPGPGDQTSTDVRSATGELISSKTETETPLGIQIRTSRISSLPTPAKAIAMGESWEATFPAVTKEGVPAAKATYKFVAEEKVGKWDGLKLEVTYTESEGGTPMKAKGVVWVSKTDFQAIKAEMDVTDFPLPPGAPIETLNLKLKLELVD